jgi:hypothetical protein
VRLGLSRLLVDVIEDFKGCIGHVQGIEVDAFDMMVDEFLYLLCSPFDTD